MPALSGSAWLRPAWDASSITLLLCPPMLLTCPASYRERRGNACCSEQEELV